MATTLTINCSKITSDAHWSDDRSIAVSLKTTLSGTFENQHWWERLSKHEHSTLADYCRWTLSDKMKLLLGSMLALFTNVCLFHHQHRPVAASNLATNTIIEYVPVGSDVAKFCATSPPDRSLSVDGKLHCSLGCMRKGYCVGFNYFEGNRTCDLFFYYPSGQFTDNVGGCQYFQVRYPLFSYKCCNNWN